MKLSPDHKLAGVLVPVFALRGTGDLGIGDTAAVKEMIDWCARHGFRVLQMLPINETGPDNSPYNAISALALDPTTIATTPQALPDLTAEDFRRIAGAVVTDGRPVNYAKVKKLKRALLEVAFQRGGKRKELAAFTKANRWLDDYTLYRALLDENGGNDNWESWPKEHQTPAEAHKKFGVRLADRCRYYAYVQFVAYEQWRDVRRYADERGVALMGDIPFGVSRTSADVWANRELFDLTWSGGAPPEAAFQPDAFTAKWGQNWGIPLYRWEAHRKEKFAWWNRRVRQTSDIFHIFRIDHVLGFYRIYAFPWPPRDNWQFTEMTEAQAKKKAGGKLPRFFPHADDTDAHKKANCKQGESLLKMIQKAAGDTIVVAEDLGLVPDYVRPNLLKLGIPGFKIPYWERNEDYTYCDGVKYPHLSIVTPATHDHDPIITRWQQMWQAHDDARAKQDHHNAYITWLELQRFVGWAGQDKENIPREFTPQLHEAFCRAALAAESWMAIFMITDIFAQPQRFNVPGSFGAGNWSARMEQTVAGLDSDKALSAKTEMFARLLAETKRD